MKRTYYLIRCCILSVLLLITGCRANQEPLMLYFTQLQQQLSEQNQSQQESQSKLLSATPSSKYVLYTAQKLQNPFTVSKPVPIQAEQCFSLSHDQHSSLEIEGFDLKGTIGSDGAMSALLQTPTGEITKLMIGDEVGEHGIVRKIQLTHLIVEQNYLDEFGCNSKRNVMMRIQ